MEQILYVVRYHQPVAVGCLWSPSPGYITGGFFADRLGTSFLPVATDYIYSGAV